MTQHQTTNTYSVAQRLSLQHLMFIGALLLIAVYPIHPAYGQAATPQDDVEPAATTTAYTLTDAKRWAALAEQQVDRIEDPYIRIDATAYAGAALVLSGSKDEGERLIQQAIAASRFLPSEDRDYAYWSCIDALIMTGNLRIADRLLKQIRDDFMRVDIRAWSADMAKDYGHDEMAVQWIEQAVPKFKFNRLDDDSPLVALAHGWLAIETEQGDENAFNILSQAESPDLIANLSASMAAQIWERKPQKAEELLTDAIALIDEHRPKLDSDLDLGGAISSVVEALSQQAIVEKETAHLDAVQIWMDFFDAPLIDESSSAATGWMYLAHASAKLGDTGKAKNALAKATEAAYWDEDSLIHMWDYNAIAFRFIEAKMTGFDDWLNQLPNAESKALSAAAAVAAWHQAQNKDE